MLLVYCSVAQLLPSGLRDANAPPHAAFCPSQTFTACSQRHEASIRLRVVQHWRQWCLFRRYQAAAARALWVKHTRQRVMDLWRYRFIPRSKARCRHLQALWLKVCCPTLCSLDLAEVEAGLAKLAASAARHCLL